MSKLKNIVSTEIIKMELRNNKNVYFQKLNLDVVFKYQNKQWNATFDACDIFHPNVSTRGQVSLHKNDKNEHISLEMYATQIYMLLELPELEDSCNENASELSKDFIFFYK